MRQILQNLKTGFAETELLAGLRVNILGHFVKPDASAVRSDFISQSVISA